MWVDVWPWWGFDSVLSYLCLIGFIDVLPGGKITNLLAEDEIMSWIFIYITYGIRQK